jgi:hypothetical protein
VVGGVTPYSPNHATNCVVFGGVWRVACPTCTLWDIRGNVVVRDVQRQRRVVPAHQLVKRCCLSCQLGCERSWSTSGAAAASSCEGLGGAAPAHVSRCRVEFNAKPARRPLRFRSLCYIPPWFPGRVSAPWRNYATRCLTYQRTRNLLQKMSSRKILVRSLNRVFGAPLFIPLESEAWRCDFASGFQFCEPVRVVYGSRKSS